MYSADIASSWKQADNSAASTFHRMPMIIFGQPQEPTRCLGRCKSLRRLAKRWSSVYHSCPDACADSLAWLPCVHRVDIISRASECVAGQSYMSISSASQTRSNVIHHTFKDQPEFGNGQDQLLRTLLKTTYHVATFIKDTIISHIPHNRRALGERQPEGHPNHR